jgi:glycosyltransferase involved in cell wall biosynthesis
MKISYAILTHNEGQYIKSLLEFLVNTKRPQDEIVIVDDYSTDELTIQTLNTYADHITLKYRVFDGDHTQKNYLNSCCSGDYILQLDADELVHKQFIEILPDLLETNSECDLFVMPRINTVTDLSESDIKKWKWHVNEQGWVNFPDWQMRLYRNCDWLSWDGLLHSKIVGFKTYVTLPAEELYCILHHKDINRQREQNDLYDQIEKLGRTKYKINL